MKYLKYAIATVLLMSCMNVSALVLIYPKITSVFSAADCQPTRASDVNLTSRSAAKIRNTSNTDTILVSCPIIKHAHYYPGALTVEIRTNLNSSDSGSCYLRAHELGTTISKSTTANYDQFNRIISLNLSVISNDKEILTMVCYMPPNAELINYKITEASGPPTLTFPKF